jgi:DNA-binding IclR family transcriptional regulator
MCLNRVLLAVALLVVQQLQQQLQLPRQQLHRVLAVLLSLELVRNVKLFTMLKFSQIDNRSFE